jgi:predicted O-methyltransferase YrrM
MKDKQTEICGIKDAESYDFVLIDHWKMANTLPFRFSKTNNNL